MTFDLKNSHQTEKHTNEKKKKTCQQQEKYALSMRGDKYVAIQKHMSSREQLSQLAKISIKNSMNFCIRRNQNCQAFAPSDPGWFCFHYTENKAEQENTC